MAFTSLLVNYHDLKSGDTVLSHNYKHHGRFWDAHLEYKKDTFKIHLVGKCHLNFSAMQESVGIVAGVGQAGFFTKPPSCTINISMWFE